MSETIMNEKELSLLKAIADDRYSIGAFSGMIYNAIKDYDGVDDAMIDSHLKLAIQIRLRIAELTK